MVGNGNLEIHFGHFYYNTTHHIQICASIAIIQKKRATVQQVTEHWI